MHKATATPHPLLHQTQLAMAIRRCTHKRPNGQPCKNKAERHYDVCHKHNGQRTVKRSEKRTALFHIFFLYGLRKYGNMQELKAECPTARGQWHHIANLVFDGRVDNYTVQAHSNRYRQWLVKNSADGTSCLSTLIHRADPTTNTASFKHCVATPSKLHLYARFNEYTLPALIVQSAHILINGVPYRFDRDGLTRMDDNFRDLDIPNTFTVLQALDGYTIDPTGSAARHSSVCTTLQQQCLAAVNVQ